MPIDQVARQVRAEVNRQALTVKHEQVPAIYDQVIGQFYFYAQNDANVDEVELVFWTSIKDSSDPAELKAYLEKYPDGQFSGLAQARIKRLEQGQVIPASKPVADAAKPTIKAEAPAPVAEVKAPVVETAAQQSSSNASSRACNGKGCCGYCAGPSSCRGGQNTRGRGGGKACSGSRTATSRPCR